LPDVPEFLLRKLYVAGSFKQQAGGFTFELNNSLMAVTVAEMSVLADGAAAAPQALFLRFPGQPEKSAATAAQEAPFLFPLTTPLTVRVESAGPPVRKLTIEARTLEMGRLKFTIDLRPRPVNPVIERGKKITAALRSAVLARKVARDPLHPLFHFTPPANWMNDPNGLVTWQGQTHLFYQYNPHAPVWGSLHWGHAVSADLVRWQRLPVALSPAAGRPDQDGCWSGSAFVTESGPVFVYTAVFPETVCLAAPDAAFRKLEPVEKNPLISAPPAGLSVEGFRDPVLWKEGERYLLSLGSGIKGQGGAVLLYESEDMRHWRYLHPLLQGDARQTEPFPTGMMWECPQLFEIEGEYFLFISAITAPGEQTTFYFQGSYHERQFIPRAQRYFDFSKHGFYAPLSFLDGQERRVIFGWLMEERPEAEYRRAGWAGALSLPRWLHLDAQHNLLVEPLPELDSLHQRQIISFSGALSGAYQNLSGGHPVVNIDLQAVIRAEERGQARLLLAETPQAAEQTVIAYDFSAGTLSVDTRASSANPGCPGELKEAPLPLKPGEALNLRVFADGSVLEVYANQRVVISSRYYPSQIARNALFIAASDPAVSVQSLRVWQMGNCQV
jgi:beta-fructofuranosidase